MIGCSNLKQATCKEENLENLKWPFMFKHFFFFKEKCLGKTFIDPMEIMLFFLSNGTNWSYNSIFLVLKNSMLLCNS